MTYLASSAHAVLDRSRWSGLDLDYLRPPAWTRKAACRAADPDLFFPVRGESKAIAKAICGQCVVRAECLQSALEHGDEYGIWGGLSANQRTRLQREKGRVA